MTVDALRADASERDTRRKSADFLAGWVLTDTDGVSLSAKLNSTAAAVTAGFGWDDKISGRMR